MPTNLPQDLKIGDKVTTEYGNEPSIVRTILDIRPHETSHSKLVADADGGEPCPHCGRRGRYLRGIDVSWFEKVTE